MILVTGKRRKRNIRKALQRTVLRDIENTKNTQGLSFLIYTLVVKVQLTSWSWYWYKKSTIHVR